MSVIIKNEDQKKSADLFIINTAKTSNNPKGIKTETGKPGLPVSGKDKDSPFQSFSPFLREMTNSVVLSFFLKFNRCNTG